VHESRSELGLRARHFGEAEPAEGGVVEPDVAATPAERDCRAATDQRLEDRQSSRGVDEDIGRREPVGHCFRKSLDPHAFVSCERPLDALSQLAVTTA
jgi:hypothetical protein